MRDARHNVGDDVLDELPRGDVVEEEERLCALHRDVVDGSYDEIDADRVVLPHEPRDERLRAHAVGRRHEQWVAQPARVEPEQATETADVTDNLGPERRAHVFLDQLDRPFAGCDVDAGARVRERFGGAVVVGCHRVADEGADSSSSTSLESTSAARTSPTGTGYSPERHAVQNDPGEAPVAATRRSSSR